MKTFQPAENTDRNPKIPPNSEEFIIVQRIEEEERKPQN